MASFLPIEKKDKVQIEARKKIWYLFDEDGNGSVEFSEAVFGLRSYFKNETIIKEAEAAILKAFNFAKDYLPVNNGKKTNISLKRRKAANNLSQED